VRRLAALGLLGLRLTVLLAVLRIRWCVRHISLGYDARKLGKLGLAALKGDQRDAMLDIIWALAGLSGPDRAAVLAWFRAWRQGRN
jgi:hypothetical protein